MWFEESLSNIKSLGSITEKTGGLAGIAKQRKLHLGQFFTPEAIVDYVWNLLSPTIAEIEGLTGEVKFFDNSCGVGSLLRYARPENHQIYGYDLHDESVKRLDEALNKHHFIDNEPKVGGESKITMSYLSSTESIASFIEL